MKTVKTRHCVVKLDGQKDAILARYVVVTSLNP
jgi:hypothetical protein